MSKFLSTLSKVLLVLLFFLFGFTLPQVYAGWVQLDEDSVQNGGTACTYDSFRDRGVRFGGDDSSLHAHADTYEWKGTSWAFITSAGPSRRVNAAMTFDTNQGKSILFGGWIEPDNYLGDTWAWDGTQWSRIATSGPHARANHAMAYDKLRGKLILFGGSYYQTIFGDTWEWDGTSWTQVTSTGPSPRIYPRMAYDESRRKVVLFGGQTTYSYYGTFFGDTWEWDGTSWTQVATTGPSPRSWQMMAYDPIQKSVVLFGGRGSGTESFNDTWKWDGTSWIQIDEYGPASRMGSCMFFDETREAIILFGGFNDNGTTLITLGDTWEYYGVPTKPTTIAPSGDIRTNPPTYTWNAVSTATQYQLWVNDATGNKIKTWYTAAETNCVSGTGTCSIKPAVTLATGNATWWVRGWNSAGYGPWSDGRAFTVATGGAKPGKATTLVPSGAITDTTPTYTWNAVSNSTWYYLWVNDSTGTKIRQWYTAAQAGCSSGTGTCAVTPATPLAAGAGQWWIQTWNQAGYGPWSAGLTFTVHGGSAPGAATLISPSGAITDTTPTYTWTAVANSTWYYLWVNDSTGTKIRQWYTAAQAGCSSGTGTCSVTPATPLAAGAGQWWIQTWNSAGYGLWSDGRVFTVSTGG